MHAKTLMFKEVLVKMGVYMPINIPELPDIELPDIRTITNSSKMSSSYDSVPPTYQHIHHTAIIQK